jgi:hypothetical protein
MMEFNKVYDMAYVKYPPIDIYSYFNDNYYNGIYEIRNIVMCNYLYL